MSPQKQYLFRSHYHRLLAKTVIGECKQSPLSRSLSLWSALFATPKDLGNLVISLFHQRQGHSDIFGLFSYCEMARGLLTGLCQLQDTCQSHLYNHLITLWFGLPVTFLSEHKHCFLFNTSLVYFISLAEISNSVLMERLQVAESLSDMYRLEHSFKTCEVLGFSPC